MDSLDKMLFTLCSQEFYEPLDSYVYRSEDWADMLQLALAGWKMVRDGVWLGFHPGNADLPGQGWKIHLSSTTTQGAALLERVLPVLELGRVQFKCALDKRMLFLMNSKRWDRGRSGKFVTIYPRSDGEFCRLIEDLHARTGDLSGPYILSDRRYRDSRVVYYRYGGFSKNAAVKDDGSRSLLIVDPEGRPQEDERLPYYSVPAWLKDPFGADSICLPETLTLKQDRYLIEAPLSQANSGGVYRALDLESGATVIIKEARPGVQGNIRGEDPIMLLRKEQRLLNKLAPYGIAPQVIDYFAEWEHEFLVEEFISGLTLRLFAAPYNIAVRTHPTDEDRRIFCSVFREILDNLASIIDILHSNSIVFSDLSPGNVLVNETTHQVHLIDFEGAHEHGIDKPTYMYTPGFAAEGQLSTFDSNEHDYYGVGALMTQFLLSVGSLSALDFYAVHRFTAETIRDSGLPPRFTTALHRMMAKDPEKRISPRQAVAWIDEKENDSVREEESVYESGAGSRDQWLTKTAEFILFTATPDRPDRLYPADPLIYASNPLGLAFGAGGTLVALQAAKQTIPSNHFDWFLDQLRRLKKSSCPSGLSTGLGGIAWCLLELGYSELAQTVLKKTEGQHPKSAELLNGLAGLGLAHLKFFQRFKDEFYLDQALVCGRELLDIAQRNDRGLFWTDQANTIHIGWGQGNSGVSLFFCIFFWRAAKQSSCRQV